MKFKVRYQDNQTLGIQYPGNGVNCYRDLEEKTQAGHQKQKFVCAVNRWDEELPDDAVALLTKTEIKEWRAWKAKHDRRFRRQQLKTALEAVPLTLRYAVVALTEKAGTVDDEQKAAIWSAMDAFSRAIENAGLGRPSRGRGRPFAQSLPPVEMGMPSLTNLDDLGSPLERAYRSLAERHKALMARCNLTNADGEDD